MERLKGGLSGGDEFATLLAERVATAMPDEETWRRDVTPPGRRGPETEVVFLTIATTKTLLVKSADLIEAGAAYRHAEANGGGNFHDRRIDGGAQAVPMRGIER